MNWIKSFFEGKSGKGCMSKLCTFLWINTVIILVCYLVFEKGAWPTVPDAVYYSIVLALGVRGYTDIKTQPAQPVAPIVPILPPQ